MGLESASFINDLTTTNPVAADQVAQGDDHLRLIKSVLKASFPNLDYARYIEQARADVADSATPDVWAATTNYVRCLGTTTITDFVDAAHNGQTKLVTFETVRTIQHNASKLDLPGSADIVTGIGDHAIFTAIGATVHRCVAYFKKNGKAVIETQEVATQTGHSGKQLTTDGSNTSWTFSPPIGSIVAWAADADPSGWSECAGQVISRTTFAALFAVIGTRYGAGDGSTTFSLPDYRGYFLRGRDPGTTRDPDSASRTDSGNGTTGANVGTKQADQFKLHGHPFESSYRDVANTGCDSTGGLMTRNANVASQAAFTGGAGTAQGQQIGGSGGSETRPLNINVKWIIRAL